MSHTSNIFLMHSISLPVLEHQARLRSVIPLISVGLFISNFQDFVHSAIHVSSSGKACMVKCVFISASGT